MSILVVAEHVRGRVRDVTFELITAANDLGGPVIVAVLAPDPSALEVDRDGVHEIVHVRVEQGEFEPDVYRSALATLIDRYRPDAVLLGFTVNSMAYAPAVSARLGLGFASDVFAVRREGQALIATRAFYGGRVHGELEFPRGGCTLLLLRPTAWPPAGPRGGARAATSEVRVAPVQSRVRHRTFLEAARETADIREAELLVAIGRGVRDKERIDMLERLAEKMGGMLAASRPIVDAGWLPKSRLVGQSGQTVRPKVYIALGISGESQHVAGMEKSGTIIAVNTNPEATIFRIADYGAVADLRDVADELDRLV